MKVIASKTPQSRWNMISFVALLMASGLSRKEIAYSLRLSHSVAERWMQRARERFNYSPAAMARYAMKMGWFVWLVLLVGCHSPMGGSLADGVDSPVLAQPFAKRKPVTYTSATLAWDPYPSTYGANALRLTWSAGSAVLPVSAVSWQVTGLRVGQVFSFQLCATNTDYPGWWPGLCDSTNWTASVLVP